MCGHREFVIRPSVADKKVLDRLISQDYIWTVNARNLEMGPDTVFRMRTKCGLTQLQFAQLIKVTPITVSRWERGTTKVSMAYATHIRKAVEEFQETRQEKVAR